MYWPSTQMIWIRNIWWLYPCFLFMESWEGSVIYNFCAFLHTVQFFGWILFHLEHVCDDVICHIWKFSNENSPCICCMAGHMAGGSAIWSGLHLSLPQTTLSQPCLGPETDTAHRWVLQTLGMGDTLWTKGLDHQITWGIVECETFWKLTRIVSMLRLWQFPRALQHCVCLLPFLDLIAHVSLSLSGLWLYWPVVPQATPGCLCTHCSLSMKLSPFPPGACLGPSLPSLCLLWNTIFPVKHSLITFFNFAYCSCWHSLLTFSITLVIMATLLLH